MSEGDIAAWPKRKKADNRRYPGEPLYKLEEIADRLGTTMHELLSLIHTHGAFTAWFFSVGSNAIGKKYNLYRLSDARRWWDVIQEKKAA